MKRLVFAFALVLIPALFAPIPAQATEISSIDIVAELQSDGSMRVTDTRTFTAQDGTEHYISLGNLADSKVSDFSVVLDGKLLTDVGEWDVDRSLEEKAGQSGVVTLDDGYELAFGFGTYGTHTAVMTYTVTNVVKNLTDGAQAVYWEFIPYNMTYSESISISLTNAIGMTYTQENSRVWGFGYEGRTAITASALTASSSGPIDSSDHMVMLAIFPEGPFATTSQLDHTAESLEAKAKEGSDFSDRGDDSEGDFLVTGESSSTGKLLSIPIPALLTIAFVAIGLDVARRSKNSTKHGFAGRVEKDEYWRDIPYDGRLEDLVALYGSPLPGLATALFLTWVGQGVVRETTMERGRFFKRDEPAFIIQREPVIQGPTEQWLWSIMMAAAGEDGILQASEIERYTRRNVSTMKRWREEALDQSRLEMIHQGLMVKTKKRVLGVFPTTKYDATDRGKELARRVVMLRNYLTDFSLLAERGASRVLLWDQYMVWAGYLGIAQEVQEQFKIVDPDYATQSSFTPNSVSMASSISSSLSSAYNDATSSSSGGGGFSSSGGGGGSFGGGSGGGIR